MTITEIISLLQKELEKRGDVEVRLYGAYGAESEVFEVAEDKNISKEERHMLWIWTGINTG